MTLAQVLILSPSSESGRVSASRTVPVEIWQRVLLGMDAASSSALRRTCRFMMDVCTIGHVYDVGSAPPEDHLLDKARMQHVTHLRTGRSVSTQDNHWFSRANSRDEMFIHLISLDITLIWVGDRCGTYRDLTPGGGRTYFPSLVHLTVRLRLRLPLKEGLIFTAILSHPLPRIETLALIDESESPFVPPLWRDDWGALLSFLSNNHTHVALALPPSWDTRHFSMASGPTSFDLGIALLVRLSANRACIRGILAEHARGPLLPALRVLEIEPTPAGQVHDIECECLRILPECPSLLVLKIELENGEDITRWMRMYPTLRRLMIKTPPRFEFTDNDLSIAQAETDIRLISILARQRLMSKKGGLRRIYLERDDDGVFVRSAEVWLPSSPYAEAMHAADQGAVMDADEGYADLIQHVARPENQSESAGSMRNHSVSASSQTQD